MHLHLPPSFPCPLLTDPRRRGAVPTTAYIVCVWSLPSPESFGPWCRAPCLYLVPSPDTGSLPRFCRPATAWDVPFVLTRALSQAVQDFRSSRTKFKGSELKGEEEGRKASHRKTKTNQEMRGCTWRPSQSVRVKMCVSNDHRTRATREKYAL